MHYVWYVTCSLMFDEQQQAAPKGGRESRRHMQAMCADPVSTNSPMQVAITIYYDQAYLQTEA